MRENPVFETINKRGTTLMNGVKEILNQKGLPFVMSGYPGMFTFALGLDECKNQRQWAESDRDGYLVLMEKMMERGVMPDFDAREPWFLSYSHSDEDINTTLSIFADVVKEM